MNHAGSARLKSTLRTINVWLNDIRERLGRDDASLL
jgi:hypothetical protein